MCDSEYTKTMIKCKHINTYKYKLRDQKIEYSTAAGPYKTTHGVKVLFSLPDSLAENDNTSLPRWKCKR